MGEDSELGQVGGGWLQRGSYRAGPSGDETLYSYMEYIQRTRIHSYLIPP